MNGPHCPKCGGKESWEPYANGDALRCTLRLGLLDSDLRCGYIHWLKNAPLPNDATAPVAELRQSSDLRLLAEKRKRIRALVHVMLQSAQPLPTRGGIVDVDAYVRVAEHIDAAIEAIGVTKDEA